MTYQSPFACMENCAQGQCRNRTTGCQGECQVRVERAAIVKRLRDMLDHEAADRIADLERQLAELRQPTAQQVEDARDAARYRWLRENHAAKEHWYDEEGVEAVRLEFAAVGDTLEEAIESEMPEFMQAGKEKER